MSAAFRAPKLQMLFSRTGTGLGTSSKAFSKPKHYCQILPKVQNPIFGTSYFSFSKPRLKIGKTASFWQLLGLVKFLKFNQDRMSQSLIFECPDKARPFYIRLIVQTPLPGRWFSQKNARQKSRSPSRERKVVSSSPAADKALLGPQVFNTL